MPVSRSGVMFEPLTEYSAVVQVCAPPAKRLAMSRPAGVRIEWQPSQAMMALTR